ncbi:hypothetical protein QEH59_13070 [Coraliomargarita sp. SDUM461004]|uniref:Uncharacterized protein n=2 Tax=Thalassobacterium sedimentorum TaxID=3041258 RepID=A0ABU1AKL9_9BACT|nr:hypothetical protein [Coraliomargarita sp. SDUM461004]
MKNVEAEDFGTLMTAIQEHSGSMRWTTQRLLATKWVATNPQGMQAYIEAQPLDKQRSLYSLLYSAWAQEAPMAAYASALQVTDQRTQQNAMQSVAQAIAEDDPQRAIEIAQEMSAIGHRADWVMRNIYQRWANQDPAAARASALSLEDGPEKVQALSGALQNWIQEDPIAALDWLDSQPMDSTIYNSRKQVFSNLLNRDFDTAKAFIASKTDPLERREVLRHVSLNNLGWRKSYDEILEIYDWVGEVATGQTYDSKVGDVIRSLAQVDPARAEAFVLDLPAGNARMNALSNYARQLAEHDPASAINFALSMGYEDEKQRVLRGMGWQLTRYGSENIRSLIASSEDSTLQRQLASQVVNDWSKYDQAGALAWAESLSDDQARSMAVQNVYANWMQAAPQQAFTYLKNSVEQSKQRNYLRSGFQQWSREDPAEAITWLSQLPNTIDENASADLYGSVANNYVQHDPMAASEWISTLEEGPARDRSVSSLVQSISRNDPEAGFIWAATLSDPEIRKNDLSRSLREWVKIDPSAAMEAVKDAAIEASEKEPLLNIIETAQNN